VLEQVHFTAGNEMLSLLNDAQIFNLHKSMGLDLPKCSFGIDPSLENDPLLLLWISTCLYLRIDLTIMDLHMVITDPFDQVLLELPKDVLVDTLEELTRAEHDVVRYVWKDEFVIEESSGALAVLASLEVESRQVESHIKRTFEDLDHEVPCSEDQAELVGLHFVRDKDPLWLRNYQGVQGVVLEID
jgi:hypothetical protein